MLLYLLLQWKQENHAPHIILFLNATITCVSVLCCSDCAILPFSPVFSHHSSSNYTLFPSLLTFTLPLGIMRLHALCHSLASPSCKDRSTIRTVPSNSTDPSTITLFSIISCMKTNSEDNNPSTQCFSYTGSSTVIHMQQDNMWLPLWSYFWSS